MKAYLCPGCGREVDAGVAHLVTWRADGVLGDAADLAARRHWHTTVGGSDPVTTTTRPRSRSERGSSSPRIARRSSCDTADGLTLVGELAHPVDRPPVATLVTLHPLPTAGGFMDSHILRKAAARLPALADLAVLRFNTRGTTSPRGTSDGSFGGGRRRASGCRGGHGVRAPSGAAATRGSSAGRSAPSSR